MPDDEIGQEKGRQERRAQAGEIDAPGQAVHRRVAQHAQGGKGGEHQGADQDPQEIPAAGRLRRAIPALPPLQLLLKRVLVGIALHQEAGVRHRLP